MGQVLENIVIWHSQSLMTYTLFGIELNISWEICLFICCLVSGILFSIIVISLTSCNFTYVTHIQVLYASHFKYCSLVGFLAVHNQMHICTRKSSPLSVICISFERLCPFTQRREKSSFILCMYIEIVFLVASQQHDICPYTKINFGKKDSFVPHLRNNCRAPISPSVKSS